MALKLFNTLTRKRDEFVPITQGKVGMYCCGPTVYNFQHIGNLRTYLFEDLLRRVLELSGLEVKHVTNITDVGHLTSDEDEGEDKMEAGARREGKTVWEIADYYTQVFFQDLEKLHIKSPSLWCKATDHIKEQTEMVDKLFEKGYAYEVDGAIYFDTAKFKTYGDLARKDMEGQQAGARVACDDGKRNSWDFALWKYSPEGEQRLMEWDYRGHKGFPGWHLECSAMSCKHLGEQFDIHCGGIDHIPIHHTNEIAQTEAVTGKKWVNWWMHGEFLLMDKAKMSKSTGGFLTLSKVQEAGYDPLDYRYLCFNTHYRKGLNFSFDTLDQAKAGRTHLRSLCEKLQGLENDDKWSVEGKKRWHDFVDALEDDLNAPRALASCWDTVQDTGLPEKERASIVAKMDVVLALDLLKKQDKVELALTDDEAALLKEREEARANKDWAKSDQLRVALIEKGIEVKDSKDGQAWSRKN